MLPYYIRQLGILKIAQAQTTPGAPKPAGALAPPKQGTPPPNPLDASKGQAVGNLMSQAMSRPDLFAPKTAGFEAAIDEAGPALKALVNSFGDDAANFGVKALMNDASNALAVPSVVERAYRVDHPAPPVDPAQSNFAPQSIGDLRRILGIVRKLASSPDVQAAPEAAGERPLDPKLPKTGLSLHDVSKSLVGDTGSTTGTGDFPKMGGDGNAQITLSQNIPHRGIAQNAGATARPELSTEFDKMKAFQKSDTSTMNSLGQGGDVVP